MEWNKISYILRGRLRKQLLIALDKPKTATILAKELKTHRSTISQSLLELEHRGYVICLDPKAPYNRYYERTNLGNDVTKGISKEN